MHDPCRILVPFDGIVHEAIRRATAEAGGSGAILIDATAGNGHDTLFLAGLCGPAGRVHAFDVQPAALEATRSRLEEAGLADRVELIAAGHEEMLERVPVAAGGVLAVVFNLGFLPGSDKSRVTRAETTLAALRAAVTLLGAPGLLSVHAYTGHQGGAEECRQVLDFFATLPRKLWRVHILGDGNKPRNGEWLVLAERIQQHLPSSPQKAPSV